MNRGWLGSLERARRSIIADPRAHRAALVAILLLATVVRVAFAWRTNLASASDASRMRGDEIGYDALAIELLEGQGLTWPGRVPLYPLWLAFLYAIAGESRDFVPYAQATLGVLTVWLTYVLGRRVAGAGVGLAASLMASVSYVLVRHSSQFMSEVLFTPILLLATLGLARALADPDRRSAGVSGAMIGIANLVRPTLLLFSGLTALLIARRARQRRLLLAALHVAMALLVVTPWLVYQTRRHKALLPLATSNAILWQGSPEYYHLLRDSGYTYLDVWEKVIYGPDDDAPNPDSPDGERYWRRRALASIGAEPGTYLLFSLEKAATYWVGDPEADWNGDHILSYRALRQWQISRFGSSQLVLARALPLLLPFAILVLWRSRRQLAAPYAVMAYCTLLHAATHAEARLSEPLQPLLLIVFAAAGARLLERGREGRSHRSTTS